MTRPLWNCIKLEWWGTFLFLSRVLLFFYFLISRCSNSSIFLFVYLLRFDIHFIILAMDGRGWVFSKNIRIEWKVHKSRQRDNVHIYIGEDKCLWKMHTQIVELRVENWNRREFIKVRNSEWELNSEFSQKLNGAWDKLNNQIISSVLYWLNIIVTTEQFCLPVWNSTSLYFRASKTWQYLDCRYIYTLMIIIICRTCIKLCLNATICTI